MSKGKKVAYSLICVFMLFMCFLCFFVCKTSKKKKIACLTFYAFVLFMLFYAFFMRIKKHLSETRLFAFYAFCTFLYFFMLFVLFCACEIFSWKRHEITLITSFIILLVFNSTKMSDQTENSAKIFLSACAI